MVLEYYRGGVSTSTQMRQKRGGLGMGYGSLLLAPSDR